MNLRSVRALLVALLFPVLATSAFALAGDAAAILQHCGPPSSDQVLHKDTPARVRVISYADTELFFAPQDGDWSFASARRASLPLPQDLLFSSMHCVSDAMEEVAARPPQAVAPTGAAAQAAPAPVTSDHSWIFLWAVGLVLVGGLFFVLRPYMRSEIARPAGQIAPRAPQRRPSATGIKFRKPEDMTPESRGDPPDDSTNIG